MGDLKLFSTEEVAEKLGYTVDYVRKLARAKKIESVRVGNRIRFTEDHIRNFIYKEQ